MSCSKLPPYILQELPDISECINYPLRTAQRIKYTCFDVSKSFIIFGATSGGIYIFNRIPCEFIQLIPNKDGTITRLAISPNEKHIAYANGRGMVTVAKCTQSLSSGHSTVTSKEHSGNEVTAMVWTEDNMLFIGDDVGKISVLQLQNFISMFQSSTQIIMNLDSRICQMDIKGCMLLVSTLTRCYICDTSQEQYRQIGQKLRDGEFGACFVDKEKRSEISTLQVKGQNFTEVKTYNIVDEEAKFSIGEKFSNTLIYCARPSSRLWEATVDGTVRRTHQYKQVLARSPMKIISLESYKNENVCISNTSTCGDDGQSVNFSKIFIINHAIFSFKKDSLYFLNLQDVDDTIWYDTYKDIVDCKLYRDTLYVWLANGSISTLRYMKIDKFLVKCYLDEKFVLCAELCALFSDHLLTNNLSTKLHILVGLRDKLQDELLKDINSVIEKFNNLKSNEATQMKSGIYVVDNTYHTQTSLLDDSCTLNCNDDNKFGTPEALQTLKDISVTVSDKLNSSKKVLKEKWEDFEEKIKNLGNEKRIQEFSLPKKIMCEEQPSSFTLIPTDSDVVYKGSSQKAIEVDNHTLDKDKPCKSLYQHFRLSLVGKETDKSNLISVIEKHACDISQIYELMLSLEQYCLTIGALDESKFAPNLIFLTYLSVSTQKHYLLDSIIKNEDLYKYFVDSCICVNMKMQKLTNIGCQCGFPLPYNRTHQTPVFSELIDDFIEKQWSNQTRDQCYEICKRMPYLWRKILFLRRNEDLLNILRILLQMLDESLLHSFLPQFTLDTWDRAIQLYATLHANICLNCNKKFDNISVKDMLSWDDLGALIIKSVGGRNAIEIMRKYADLIDTGELTIKFYHTCLLVTMYEKYDITIRNRLVDALYSSYDFEDSRKVVCQLLRNTTNGDIKNTALPIIIAANCSHWGLTHLTDKISKETNDMTENSANSIKYMKLQDIITNIQVLSNGVVDCVLCGLPLQNEVLIKDGGLWVFQCSHIFHGACLDVNKVKLCPSCSPKIQ